MILTQRRLARCPRLFRGARAYACPEPLAEVFTGVSVMAMALSPP
ncbi:hypothetical protein SALBM135S_03002 [Streptomyces alboniger]